MLGNVGGSIFDPQKAKQDAKVLRWLVFFVVKEDERNEVNMDLNILNCATTTMRLGKPPCMISTTHKKKSLM